MEQVLIKIIFFQWVGRRSEKNNNVIAPHLSVTHPKFHFLYENNNNASRTVLLFQSEIGPETISKSNKL